jgi:hypothetical protein
VAAVTREQRDAEARLKRLDLLGEGRRGDMQARGRTAEVQLLGDGYEVPQLA